MGAYPMHVLGLSVLASLLGYRAVGADSFRLESGFVSLFNGQDLSGRSYTPEEKFDGKVATADGWFAARDGVLIVHPRAPRMAQRLWTTQEYSKDFMLRLEFRTTVNADSGIFIRKPQLQCRDYSVAGPEKYKQLKKYPSQDWKEIEVTVKGGLARYTCDGEVLEDALKVPEMGPIGLEADSRRREYRRIRIKELP